VKVRRDIGSIPLRSAEETWRTIKQLVTGADSVDAGQLDTAASVMAVLITDEVFRTEPLTLAGVGPRLVIYLRHGVDALEQGGGVDALTWNPTAGDWTLFVPCGEGDFEWTKKTLASRAARLVVLKPGETPGEHESARKSESFTIDWKVFDK
jgi:hypothetical protein